MNRAAYLAIRLARHIAPEHRNDWVDAMQAELEYTPTQDNLTFAAGCLISAFKERTTHMFHSGIGVAKSVCIVACFLLASLGFANAVRLNHEDATLGILFGLLAVTWSAAFVATAFKSWRNLGRVAIGGLVLSVVQGLGVMLSQPEVQQNSTLIWALFLEGLVLFGALFCAAQIFKRKQGGTMS